MVELVDLSGSVEAGQPVYPGNQPTQYWTHKTHEDIGRYNREVLGKDTESVALRMKAADRGMDGKHPMSRALLLDEHGPTHVDALTHLDPTNDESIDRMPLEYFFGPALGLDVSDVPAAEFIERSDLTGALADAELDIERVRIVTLHTGHRDRHYAVDDPVARHRYLHDQPGLTREAATFLGEHGIKNVGIDAPSIDHSSALETKDYQAHAVGAAYDMTNMENMANLDRVAGRYFTLSAFPLKIEGGTGSPIRPVAIIGDGF